MASGAEHLELDLAGGYGRIPAIGTLFLLQAATALALALVVAATARPLASLGGALFALATLGGYLLSLSVGLLGFHEVVTGAGIASGLIDVAAFSVLALAGVAAPAGASPESAPAAAGPKRSFPFPPPAARVAVLPIALAALAALAVELSVASPDGGTSAKGTSALTVVQLPRYGRVLANARGDTLYLLRGPRAAQVSCGGGCLSLWPPLLVGASAREVRAGPGLAGKIGLVPRDGERQVTYNGYRLYTYAGDSGPRQSNGEGVVSFGGTWYLVRASALGPGASAVTHAS